MPAPYRDVSTMSMGESNRELDSLTGDDPTALERQAGLFDALLSCNLGMGGARRDMGQRKRPDNHESRTPEPESDDDRA